MPAEMGFCALATISVFGLDVERIWPGTRAVLRVFTRDEGLAGGA
jgi:hypothetical protein